MVVLRTIHTAVPQSEFTSEEILARAKDWLRDDPGTLALFQRFVSSSKIRKRHLTVPLHEILALEGVEERAQIFRREGTQLATAVISAVLEETRIHPREINTVIFTSCSAPIIPALDAYVLPSLGFAPTVTRIPLYQQGCAGGAVGLRLASSFGRTLVVSVELCSLVFQPADLRGGNLVGSALFADGAAAALVTDDGPGLTLVGHTAYLVPGATHLMGYEILPSGAHLSLDRELPSILADHAGGLITEFLSRYNLTPEQIGWWLFHPGGAKILSTLGEMFSLNASQMKWSWDVLAEYGNMSSASILFVISKFMHSTVCNVGDYALAVGVGPGLTIELLLYQRTT